VSLLNTIAVGSSGLRAASESINIISQNTANAATEGYSRQELNVSTSGPYYSDGLWLGTGVGVDSITRITDVFVSERFTEARGDAAGAEASFRAHQLIEGSFSQENGISGKLTDFFDALDELSADPSDTGHRLAAVAAADAFAETVNYGVDQLNDIQAGISEQMMSNGDGISLALDRIAHLNGLIAPGGANDLADERDLLINQLADTLGVVADYSAEDGQATVFLGGHALVMGDNAREVFIDSSGDTPVVEISADGGRITVTDDVRGAVGGLIESWETAQMVKDEMDTFIDTFAGAFNDQHQLGFDANGNNGIEFFSFSASDPAATLSVSSQILADDGLMALADEPSAQAGDRGNLDQLISLQYDAVIDGETPEGFMAKLYTTIGDAVNRAEVNYVTETAALEDAESLRMSISGVDLDEEAASLLEWQAAYQAAARVVTTSNELLNELMNIVR